jgi:hypothetical protein
MLLSCKLLSEGSIVSLDVLHLLLGLLRGFIVPRHSTVQILPEVGVRLQRTGILLIGVGHILPGVKDQLVIIVDFTRPSAAHYSVLFSNGLFVDLP